MVEDEIEERLAKGYLAPEKVGVFLSEFRPLFGKVVRRENRRDGTDGDTSAAIDALYRVNEEHFFAVKLFLVLFRVNAIDRTSVDASCVLCPDAGFGDYVSHLKSSFFPKFYN